MAAANATITLSNGDSLSVYTNSDAIGAPVRVLMSGTATSTSPLDFMVRSVCFIEDIVTAQTAGILEVFRNYKHTGKTIPMDARFAYTMIRKDKVPRIGFVPGVKYSLVVQQTMS